MSGDNVICVATVLLEKGILPMTEPETVVTLETPTGLIKAKCRCVDAQGKSLDHGNDGVHRGPE